MSLPVPFFAELSRSASVIIPLGTGPFGRELGITNSMIVSWVVAIVIIAVVQIAMRAPKLVPTGMQNFVEWIVEALSNLLEKILGHEMMVRGYWFFATIFVFIVGCNIVSLFPGVGSFGYGVRAEDGHFEVLVPFLRGANADVNMTSAMAILFFFLWFYWTFTKIGIGGFVKHTFVSPVKYANSFANGGMALLFLFLGCIELISIIVIRPLAFTFRLYGNIYGGEYLLDAIYEKTGYFAGVIMAPFYGYELLVAFIQAFVFCVLTAVFTSLTTNISHPEGEGDHGH